MFPKRYEHQHYISCAGACVTYSHGQNQKFFFAQVVLEQRTTWGSQSQSSGSLTRPSGLLLYIRALRAYSCHRSCVHIGLSSEGPTYRLDVTAPPLVLSVAKPWQGLFLYSWSCGNICPAVTNRHKMNAMKKTFSLLA